MLKVGKIDSQTHITSCTAVLQIYIFELTDLTMSEDNDIKSNSKII